MPIRNPQEQGIRRPWNRRFGLMGFPKSGGLNKQGRPSDPEANEYRELENMRWITNRIRERGGQTALLAAPLGQCILGMAQVQDSINILIGSTDDTPSTSERRIDRYSEDTTPNYLEPTVSADDDIANDWPQLLGISLRQTMGRHCYVNFAGKLLSYNETTKRMMRVNFPPLDTPYDQVAVNTHLVLEFDLSAYPQIASMLWHYEPDDLADSPTFGTEIPVLYMSTVLGGLILRWDGTNLTQDVSVPLGSGTQRLILSTWGKDICCTETGLVYVRNFRAAGSIVGQWNKTVPLSGAVVSFLPTCGRDFFGRPFFGGWGSDQLIYYDPVSNTMLGHKPEAAGPRPCAYVADLAMHQGVACYLWTEGGVPSPQAWIGTVDANMLFDDTVVIFVCEDTGWTGRLLSSENQLFVTVHCTSVSGGEFGHLMQIDGPVDHAAVPEELHTFDPQQVPADMALI